MQAKLKNYVQIGGKLLISGSYTGTDMQTPEEQAFLAQTLKLQYSTVDSLQPTQEVQGLGMRFTYYNTLNDKHYAATHPEILEPVEGAFCAMKYLNETCAAVAYKGTDYRSFTMGFPFECITDERQRASIMQGILKFLTE